MSIRAKQSQFGAAGRLRAGRLCQTKPIPPTPGRRPGDENAQNKPNWPERVARNKANLLAATGRRWRQGVYEKQTQSADAGPDKRGLGRLSAGPSLGPIAPNKANLPTRQTGGPAAGTFVTGDKRAKQSQFRRRGRTGKYFVEKELWRIEHAGGLGETKPISARTALAEGRQVGRRCRTDELYKQTQFAPDGHGRPSSRPPAQSLRSGQALPAIRGPKALVAEEQGQAALATKSHPKACGFAVGGPQTRNFAFAGSLPPVPHRTQSHARAGYAENGCIPADPRYHFEQ